MSPALVLQLQRSVGNRAAGARLAQAAVARHRVATTAIDRATALELLGDGTPANPGMTLEDFVRSTRAQADWFVEPTLTAADRDDLWALLRRVTAKPDLLEGVGDLHLAELRTVAAGQWADLEAFSRCCAAGNPTVRVVDRTRHSLRGRIDFGDAVLALEAIIPGAVLELTVSEDQVVTVYALGLIPQIADYWNRFHPHLQRLYTPGPGARGQEFEAVIDLLVGTGIAPFAPLLGRVRNLHRFSVPVLNQLLANFADTSRGRPVHLVLFTGHDESSFAEAAPLFADLILNSPNNVLVLEGQEHLADITTAIPAIAASHGQPDSTGTPRIAQAMLAGHGEARTIEMAGTGAPNVADGHVSYPSESMDLDDPARAPETTRLLDALVHNLDPATARIVFAGCLVGSNHIPFGTPTADMAAHMAANPSLGAFTQQLGTAAGLGPDLVHAARASVGLGAAGSLMDASGNLEVDYDFDPDAYGSALAYVATGHEPAGTMRAAVEVAATDALSAGNQLRVRQGHGVDPTKGWYDEMTMVLVNRALLGVPPAGPADPQLLNELAEVADVPFLSRWPGSFAITVGHFRNNVNQHPGVAGDIYTGIEATGTFRAPGDIDAQTMRLIIEQARIANGEGREAALLAYLDATGALTAQIIRRNLDVGALAGSTGTLFAGAPPTAGQLRLALAWFDLDPANADVRALLDAQVDATGPSPVLNAAARAQLDGFSETDILEALGRLMPVAPAVGGGPALPSANAEIMGTGDNRALIEPHPYEANVTADVLNMRPVPHMGRAPVDSVRRGDALNVMGFTHNWAAVDHNGRLLYVHRNWITPPP